MDVMAPATVADTTPPGGDQPSAPSRRPRRRLRRDRLMPYLLSLPSLVVLAALLGYPLFQMVHISLEKFERAQLFELALSRREGQLRARRQD